MRDIAEKVGLSRATVSLVLRDSPLVAEETRERVRAAMRELGYVYNRAAASLRTRRSLTIAVVVPDITNPFFAELTVGSESRLDAAGYVMLLGNTSESLAKQERVLAAMREFPADGILLCPVEGSPPETLAGLRDAGIPLVQVARYLPGVDADYVGPGNVAGAALAAEHLIGLGHQRIAFVGGPEHVSARQERLAGYADALTRHGLPLDPSLVVPTPTSREGGFAAVEALLAQPQPPTAVQCFNDVVALGVMLGVQSRGLTPGRDVAVVGFDDIADAALARPSLTTVAANPARLGAEAAVLLLRRISEPNASPRQVVPSPRLVVRESSGSKESSNHGPT